MYQKGETEGQSGGDATQGGADDPGRLLLWGHPVLHGAAATSRQTNSDGGTDDTPGYEEVSTESRVSATASEVYEEATASLATPAPRDVSCTKGTASSGRPGNE